MIARASRRGCRPARVIDPGSGSARFLIAAGRRWPSAELVGVEIDPVAALIGRASLAAAGLAGRSRIILGDYRSVALPPCAGPTLFLGNPPYVRHHQIAPRWKDWLRRTAASRGLPASGLAGLHVHFFLATALHARPGDAGVLITAAEWLDVNYGRLVRGLLLDGLGGESLHLIDPAVPVFTDAMATSVITCFRPGRRHSPGAAGPGGWPSRAGRAGRRGAGRRLGAARRAALGPAAPRDIAGAGARPAGRARAYQECRARACRACRARACGAGACRARRARACGAGACRAQPAGPEPARRSGGAGRTVPGAPGPGHRGQRGLGHRPARTHWSRPGSSSPR